MTTNPGSDLGAVTISAVLTSFQHRDYVAEAVESLLAQDPPFQEVVVVDDGSTDGSVEVLKGYADRITFLQQVNAGQLAASVTALARCTGDYVYFLDSDDAAEPTLTATLLPLLADRPVKAQFQLTGVDGDGHLLASVFPTFPDGYTSERMRHDNATGGFYVCPPTSGNVFHRETLLGIDLESLAGNESMDGVPALMMPHLGEVLTVAQALARYRVHGRNKSLLTRQDNDRQDQSSRDRDKAFRDRVAYEIERFERRWVAAASRLDLPRPPFGDRVPTFVLERRLLIAALGGGPSTAVAAARYLVRRPFAGLPRTQQSAFTIWVLLLGLVPVPGVRRQLIVLRRTSPSRPAWLRAVNRWLHRGART